MKKTIHRLLTTFILSLFSIFLLTASNKGIEIEVAPHFILKVSALNDKTIHIQKYHKDQLNITKSMVVNLSDYPKADYKKETSFETSLLRVAYDKKTRNLKITNKQTGETILEEKGFYFTHMAIAGDKGYSVSQAFSLANDEAIYGLGQFQDGVLNHRDNEVLLVHANREIANPVLVSTKNYVLYWDNYSKTTFKDSREDGAVFWSEMAEGINYYLVYGEDMKDAMAGFRDLTGQSPMLPKSAFGYWMSKERYASFDELTSVVDEYRNRNIPIDNIVQDWQYWGVDRAKWNSMEFDATNFANPKQVIDKLHDIYNVKLTLSVWPGVGPATKIYQSMDSVGALFDVPTWAGYKVVDIYNPKAQDIYWRYLKKGLYDVGVDSWWMDATEPSFRDGLYQSKQEEWTKLAGETHIGPFVRYLNTYSLVLSEMMYKNLRKTSNKRVSILTRSAFAGQQKYGTSTWSGDIYASWDVYKKQIAAGLNLCMTGIPYWTTDIGGFRVKSTEKAGAGAGEVSSYVDETKVTTDGGYTKGLEDPAYLELYTRWFQYGVFNPMFRAHGTEVPREIWHFGKPGTPFYEAQLEMIDLRYSLLSYIYSTAWQVTSAGATMMRPTVVDFTNDEGTHDNANQFMFGDALLVNPVTFPMYYDRDGEIKDVDTEIYIYLPRHKGEVWYELSSNDAYSGGEKISWNAPLNEIPVFVKGGSIVPRNQVVQYANEDDNSVMDIYVYPGTDATFDLYEDDNETYDYEKGSYSLIRFQWNEKDRTLSIAKPEGTFKHQFDKRMFNIFIVNSAMDIERISIEYRNKAEKIQFGS